MASNGIAESEKTWFISQKSPLSALLGKLPVAAYTCDREGHITYFNRLARAIWGRKPRLNDPKDKYCGSSKLFWSGDQPMPRESCWMARALLESREYNGCEVIIQQPTGERIPALAYANPIYDENGELSGALNLLVRTDQKPRRGWISFAPVVQVVIVTAEREATNLAFLLAAMGHDVKTAVTGLDAIQIAKSFRPRLMFVNTALPQMDGYEVARTIRRAAWGRTMVLVALTHDKAPSLQRARDAGFDHEISTHLNMARILPILAHVAQH